ncbi:MAG: 3TM-type holin [Henriciella sp.]
MIGALLPAVLPLVKDVVGSFLPEDPKKRAEAERKIEAQLTEHLAKIDMAQLEVNKTEAAHRSVFIAGWRPFVGWACGVSLAWSYICQPILTFALVQAGYGVELPALDMSQMMPVLMGMLGLGGLRSFEKYKGVSK